MRHVNPLSETPIYLSKQSKFAINLPIPFIFDFWSRDMSCDRNLNLKAQEALKNYFWGKIHIVLGLLARDVANQSIMLRKHL